LAPPGSQTMILKGVLAGGRNWDRTSDPSLVRRVLYR
jgi:hypothetical protein